MSELNKYDTINNRINEKENKVDKLEKDYIEGNKKLDNTLNQWMDKRIHEMREIARRIEAKLDDMKIKLE